MLLLHLKIENCLGIDVSISGIVKIYLDLHVIHQFILVGVLGVGGERFQIKIENAVLL